MSELQSQSQSQASEPLSSSSSLEGNNGEMDQIYIPMTASQEEEEQYPSSHSDSGSETYPLSQQQPLDESLGSVYSRREINNQGTSSGHNNEITRGRNMNEESSDGTESQSRDRDHRNGDRENILSPLQQHSYLPGTQHPLYPVEFLQNSESNMNHTKRMTSTTGHEDPDETDDAMDIIQHPTIAIPILEMDLVLFPNTTLPLRITNRSFCQYLKREIEMARASNGELQVRIGVVPRTRQRRRVEFQQRQRQRRTAQESDNPDSEEEGDADTSTRRRRRRTGTVRMGRWNMALIRRNFQASPSSRAEEDETGRAHRNSEERSINYGRSLRRDKLMDRIGTFATITSADLDMDMNGNGGSEDANAQNQGNEVQQIIVTAFTTGRFQVISPVGEHNSDDFEWRMYNVKEINGTDAPIPSIFRRPRPARKLFHGKKDTNDDKSEGVLEHNKQLIREISNRTPLSPLALQLILPAKIVKDIISELKSNKEYEGIEKSLPDTDVQFKGHFSFWLSSNLPLSDVEKLDLLETYSDAERLRLLLHMIRKRTKFMRCKNCKANIANMSSVFSLDSSAGTSGAYVNEYGVVHHTTTIRNTLDGAVLCHGPAETRDSWFPGYSWTIAYCSTCYNHLGWKFLPVESGMEFDEFWGLSGSQFI